MRLRYIRGIAEGAMIKITAGGLAVILAALALAQQLSGYQNTPVAAVLVILAVCALIWFLALWLRDGISWPLVRAAPELPISGKILAGIFQFSVASTEELSPQLQIFLRASVTNGEETLQVGTWKLSASLEGRRLKVHGPLTIPGTYVFHRSQPVLKLGLTEMTQTTEYPTARLDHTTPPWQPNEMRVGWLYFKVEDVDENQLRDRADLTLKITDTKRRTATLRHRGGDSWPEIWGWLDSITLLGDYDLRTIEGNKPPANLRYFSR